MRRPRRSRRSSRRPTSGLRSGGRRTAGRADDERRPTHGTHDDGRRWIDGRVVGRVRHPHLTGEADVPRVQLVADLVEGQGALADETAVDAGPDRARGAMAQTAAEEGPD